MLANWVKETTATTGTGAAVTLGGAAGSSYIRYQDSGLPIGSKVIYNIEDGNDREIGEGILTSTTVLTRTKSLMKLVSGTVTRNSGTFLSLSGTAVIGMSTPAEMIGGSASSYGTTSLGGSIAKRFNNAATLVGTNSTFAMVANTLYITPYKLDVGIPLAALNIYITTLAAAGNLALGVYTMLPDGTAGALLASASGISTGSTGIARGTTSSVFLPPGWYWVAALSDSTPTIQVISGAIVSPLGSNNSDPRLTLNRMSASAAYSSGLPNPAPTSGWSTQLSNAAGAVQVILEAA